jgi:formylglycine-generating enzyme
MLLFILLQTLTVIMRFYKPFIIFCLLYLLSSCTEKAEEQASKDIHPSFSELPEVLEEHSSLSKQRVLPVQISPEDQVKADNAPEGMVLIKGGCFIMGNDYTQEDEKPEHEVCVDDFYMDIYEMTQSRWEKIMGFNPSKFVGANFPVEQVNFLDVQKYIKNSKGLCRLPTEAEWEYAARGGTSTRYFWGNMVHEDYTWYEDNSADTTHFVGGKAPNQYGLYDMMGNVWEWVNDWYEPYYKVRSKNNPQGPESGESKVVRGGSFDSSAGALRITNRVWLHPKNKVFPKVTTYGQIINEVFNFIGFRCAHSVPKNLTKKKS